MLGKRLPLLSGFAGGCLSSAVLLGFWLAGAPKAAAPVTDAPRRHSAEDLSSLKSVPDPSHEQAGPDDGARRAALHGEPTQGTNQVEDEQQREPVRPEHGATTSGETAPDPGSSVADVLGHLEASYRAALAVADVRDAHASAARAPTPVAAPEAEPSAPERMAAAHVPPPPVSEPPAGEPPASPTATQAQPVVAIGAAAPAANGAPDTDTWAPVAAAPPASGGEAPPRGPEAAPANININNVYQGNVYQIQQLAVLQYIQLLAQSPSAGLAAQPRASRPGMVRTASRFPTTLTNPDNPWGFNFSPLNLVK